MSIQWKLIRIDFLRLKRPLAGYGLLALCAAAIMCVPHKTANFFGTILMVFVMVAFFCHLVMRAVIEERKAHNHLFLMTLPVSTRQLMVTKVTAVTLMFCSIWIPAVALTGLLSLVNDHWSGVALAFYAVSFFSYLPAFALILLAAIFTFSEGITILAFTLSNMLVVLVLNFVPQSDFMQEAFAQGSIAEAGFIWPDQITLLIFAELTLFIALMTLCYCAAFCKNTFVD